MPHDELGAVRRGPVGPGQTVAGNRRWWDAEAEDYLVEHGDFLGDSDLVWGPEGWRESELRLLGDVRGRTVLEFGGGAGQCARWVQGQGGHAVSTDLSMGMIRTGLTISARVRQRAGVGSQRDLPFVQADACALPFADASVDVVLSSYGAVPFVAEPDQVMREAARVLRPGGRLVFSTTHPIRWSFPDVPGEAGLVVEHSYFDRRPYVEEDTSGGVRYAEHHRTLGDRVRDIVAAGLVLVDLVEPEWKERNDETWGGWSPLRGRLIPGTAIFVCDKPAAAT